MINIFLLQILFVLSLLFEQTVLHSGLGSVSMFPLHFLIGMLVMHRSGPELGASWFIATAIMVPLIGFDKVPWYGYIIVGVVGALLTTRVFTNRSIYALLGMTIFLYLVLTTTQWLARPESVSIGQTLWLLAFIVLGTYAGFMIARLSERLLQTLFLVKQSNA